MIVGQHYQTHASQSTLHTTCKFSQHVGGHRAHVDQQTQRMNILSDFAAWHRACRRHFQKNEHVITDATIHTGQHVPDIVQHVVQQCEGTFSRCECCVLQRVAKSNILLRQSDTWDMWYISDWYQRAEDGRLRHEVRRVFKNAMSTRWVICYCAKQQYYTLSEHWQLITWSVLTKLHSQMTAS